MENECERERAQGICLLNIEFVNRFQDVRTKFVGKTVPVSCVFIYKFIELLIKASVPQSSQLCECVRSVYVLVWPNCLFNQPIFHFSIHSSIVYSVMRDTSASWASTDGACLPHTFHRQIAINCEPNINEIIFCGILHSLGALIEFRWMQTKCRQRSNVEPLRL